MNEQFSRLYHLAWNYALSDPEYQESPTYERRCVVQSRIFAELIVAECVRYFNEDYKRDFDTLWREDLTKGIKQHFGVEQ